MGQQWDQRINQKIPWNKWKWGYNFPKSGGHRASNSMREIHSITGLSQIIKRKRKISNKQSDFILKWSWKRTTKLKVSRRKEIIKVRGETNKVES